MQMPALAIPQFNITDRQTMKIIKRALISISFLLLLILLLLFIIIRGSLPTLDDKIVSNSLSNNATLARDTIGTAVINADTEYDAAYLLGYAHAQDRLFQMDLLRRQSAGELSALVGKAALNIDKKHRIHQFRSRAENTFKELPEHQQLLLTHYTKGVNEAAQKLAIKPYEYFILGTNFAPWKPSDSLMATYSMYIDLQLAQTEIDFRLTALKEVFGQNMFNFFTLPSNFQSAIDYSTIRTNVVEIPSLPEKFKQQSANMASASIKSVVNYDEIQEQPDYGSNNWAVAGYLTNSESGMLSNDMHLGLNVPAIWYRAQLNYAIGNKLINITGVSLPGTPAIIVGSNGHIAWGFTNSNVDNVDWVELNDDIEIHPVTEIIETPEGPENFEFETTEIGPVREFNGKKYALKWVAHQNYAVNMRFADMAKMRTVDEALTLASKVRIPAQNMAITDAQGNVAWQLTGAITARSTQIRHAIKPEHYSPLWEQAEQQPANVVNPDNGRVWTANARVVSTNDLPQYGDGGYALGARQQQIMTALMQQDSFSEQDFYNIQLDNKALFLSPWHNLLLATLNNSPQKYKEDIELLNTWRACACADSVGYTLVRRFRSGVINTLLAPVNKGLAEYDLSTSYLLRGIEPAIWALLQKQPSSWLPSNYTDYTSMLMASYDNTKSRLLKRYGASANDLSALTWGNVNQIHIKHPFSKQLSFMSNWLDMPKAQGFGDSYMPAVQAGSFGASQRLIVRQGNEDNAILTVPGGQSGHFLSDFYRSGYQDYVTHNRTPLLPMEIKHRLEFIAQ